MKNLMAVIILGTVFGAAAVTQAVPAFFLVPMTGGQEVPGPGDPDGIGVAFLAIDPDTLAIDWNITVDNIDLPPTAAHIHVGAAGVAGPPVVDFSGQLTGDDLTDADLAAVLANPANYYVNVHNQAFPDGAIRGQLPCPCPVIPAPPALALAAIGLVGLRLHRRRLA